tara:strand:- start:93 stop:773 length:681 start_codon:yes stop_codon:yes gene_type:complete
MPVVFRDTTKEDEFELALLKQYADEPERKGIHVSDLITCMRQGELRKKYNPEWNFDTLLRFSSGRAFEKTLGKILLPKATQELEVTEDGIIGSIDFADEPIDFEFKLTWKRVANEEEEVEKLFDDNWYWVDQACSYAIMRRRRSHYFAVLFVGFFIPSLRVYRILWTPEEQGDTWTMMKNNRDYLIACRKQGILPLKTTEKKFCNYCEMKSVCDSLPEEMLVGDFE